MKCQILFSGKIRKKYFNMSFAENLTQSAKPNTQKQRNKTNYTLTVCLSGLLNIFLGGTIPTVKFNLITLYQQFHKFVLYIVYI